MQWKIIYLLLPGADEDYSLPVSWHGLSWPSSWPRGRITVGLTPFILYSLKIYRAIQDVIEILFILYHHCYVSVTIVQLI